jgi:hypothetical protein
MQAQVGFSTVFRSMDSSAKEDCQALVDKLSAAGLQPLLIDDSAPGVPEGVFEVRVPAAEAARAEEIAREDHYSEPVDNSESMDLETIAEVSEVEALGIQSLLESGGVTTVVLVGDSVLPNFPFEVRVPREHAEQARQLIAQAEKGGPAAAAEAEAAGEIENSTS